MEWTSFVVTTKKYKMECSIFQHVQLNAAVLIITLVSRLGRDVFKSRPGCDILIKRIRSFALHSMLQEGLAT